MLEIDAGAIECEAALQGSEILQDDIGIQPLHLASNALGGLVWTHGRSQEKERARRRRFLPERQVDHRFELLTKGVSLHDIRDNPDDGTPLAGRVSIRRTKTLAEWLFAGPEPRGKALVHNGDRHSPHMIAVVEVAAGYRGGSDDSEVIRSGP